MERLKKELKKKMPITDKQSALSYRIYYFLEENVTSV